MSSAQSCRSSSSKSCGPECSCTRPTKRLKLGEHVPPDKATPMSTTVIYTPLDVTDEQIRLLTILPGHISSPVCCQITTWSLRTCPTYTALSYTWGQPDSDCSIETAGGRLPVTKNLLRFLRQARELPDYRNRLFWVDAACIDQSNTTERGQQVAQMSKIFKQAETLVLWLGPDYEKSDLAMRALRRQGQPERRFRGREGIAIRRLCGRRYWTRLWVLQELVLAPERHILCGKQQISWKALNSLFNIRPTALSLQKRQEANHVYDQIRRSPAQAMWAQVAATSGDTMLYHQIIAARDLKCSDVRDKAYGVLAISKASESISADYSISPRQLAHNLLQHQDAMQQISSLEQLKSQCEALAETFEISLGDIYATDIDGKDDIALHLPESLGPLDTLRVDAGPSLGWAIGLGLSKVGVLCLERIGNAGKEAIRAAVWTAIVSHDVTVLHRLLDCWQSVPHHKQFSLTLDNSATPLHAAAWCGNADAIRILLNRDILQAPVCRRSRVDVTKIDVNAVVTLEILLSDCPILSIPRRWPDEYIKSGYIDTSSFDPPRSEWTALGLALQREHKEPVAALLSIEGTALIACRAPDGAHSSLLASSWHHDDAVVISTLLDNVNAKSLNMPFDGHTPLMSAILSNSAIAVQLLLQCQGTDVNFVVPDSEGALHFAARQSVDNSLKLLELVLSDRATCVNIRDSRWRTPLQVCIEDYLKKIDMSPHTRLVNMDAYTRREYDNWTQRIRMLLEAGADVNVKQYHGATPLHSIAMWDIIGSITCMLLAKGADVDARTDTGRTPLHCASWNAMATNCRLLLEQGASPHVADDTGRTPDLMIGLNEMDETDENDERLPRFGVSVHERHECNRLLSEARHKQLHAPSFADFRT